MQFLLKITKYSTRILLIAILFVTIFISVSSFDKNYYDKVGILKDTEEIEDVKIKITSFPGVKNNNFVFEGEICEDESINGVRAEVNIENGSDYDYEPGDIVRIFGKVYLPQVKDNDGGFDNEGYYKSRNIHCRIYSEKAYFAKSGSNGFLNMIYSARCRFIENTDRFFKNSHGGIVKALLCGERSGVDYDDSLNFRKSGVYHIIAISGLHLNIFIMFVSYLISVVRLKRFKKAMLSFVLCVLCALFVLVFTGFGLSVVRAFVMLFICLAGTLVSRKYSSKNSLFMSAALILIFIPSSFYSIGFILSVLSTLGVLISADIIRLFKTKKRFTKITSSGVFSTALTSVICSVTTLPVMLTSFGYLPVYSPVANVLILPLVTPALGLSIVFAFLSFCGFDFLAKIVSYAVTGLIELILIIADIVANLPLSTVTLYPLYTMYIILIVAGAMASLYFIFKKKLRHCICAVLIFTLAVSSVLLYNNFETQAKIIFADVSQGDCAIVILPENEAVMIDFGTTSQSPYITDEIKSTLIKNNVRKISAMFVSHFHTDHASGAETLVNEGYVNTLFLPKYYPSADKESKSVRKSLLWSSLKENTDVCYVSEGSRVCIGENAVFTVISPDSSMYEDANDMSLVIKFEYGDVSFLFTGDISENGVKALYNKNIDCDVLKVPHHGGKNIMMPWLIKNCNSDYAVISCGPKNRYKHPADETLDALENAGAKILRTDRSGAISFEIDTERIKKVDKKR